MQSVSYPSAAWWSKSMNRGHIKQISTTGRECNSKLSARMNAQFDAINHQTSLILDFVSATPGAIAGLHSITAAHAEEQSRQVKTLHQGLASVTSHLETLSLDVSSTSAIIGKHACDMRRAAGKLFNLFQDIKKLLLLYHLPQNPSAN
jgi:hypothetical protein